MLDTFSQLLRKDSKWQIDNAMDGQKKKDKQ